MPRLIDQDPALFELGMWPGDGRHFTPFDALDEADKRRVYKNRNKLTKMLRFTRLPGEEAKKYRTKDIDALIERNTAA